MLQRKKLASFPTVNPSVLQADNGDQYFLLHAAEEGVGETSAKTKSLPGQQQTLAPASSAKLPFKTS
jgi:hypothetical protein